LTIVESFPRPEIHLPGGPGPLTSIHICAPHNIVKKYCATHKYGQFKLNPGVLRNG